MTSFKEKQRSKNNYKKFFIDKKIKAIITKQNKQDNRYFVFKKVLCNKSITECQFHLPRQLFTLEPGRKFAVHGNYALQKILRNQYVFSNNDSDKQRMTFAEFNLEVADKFGLPNARLAPQDKALLHETSLQVFCKNNSKKIVNLI